MMKLNFQRFVLMVLGAVLAMQTVGAQGKEVLILIHGLGGFDKILGIPYWAQKKVFEDAGFEVHEVNIGAVSSNWARACETFAQIKGTVVDYGKAHAAKWNHTRYGKSYVGKGLYPEWGPNNKVHLLGHSMGGSTTLMLERLLQEGDADEIAAVSRGETLSQLFSKQGNWISSVITVAGVLDGTPLAGIFGDELIQILKVVIMSTGVFFDDTLVQDIYDFKLEYYGILPLEGETFGQLWARLSQHKVFQRGYQDVCAYDLRPEGMLEIQQRGQQAYEGTYYLAFATGKTSPEETCEEQSPFRCGEVQIPKDDMLLALKPFATVMGNLDRDPELRPNDGLVPTIAQYCPSLVHGKENCFPFVSTDALRPGAWFYQEIDMDHVQTMGIDIDSAKPVANLYRQISAILATKFTLTEPGNDGTDDEGTDTSNNQSQGNDDPQTTVTIAAASTGAVLACIGIAAVLYHNLVKERLNTTKSDSESQFNPALQL